MDWDTINLQIAHTKGPLKWGANYYSPQDLGGRKFIDY